MSSALEEVDHNQTGDGIDEGGYTVKIKFKESRC